MDYLQKEIKDILSVIIMLETNANDGETIFMDWKLMT